MRLYFIPTKKQMFVLAVPVVMSLCFFYLNFFSNYYNKQIIRKREIQIIKYTGVQPVCLRSHQAKDQVLCSKLRYTVRTVKTALEVNNNSVSEEHLEVLLGDDLEPGGLYRPKDCSPDQRVAIIVPYRDREAHLKVLINHLHPFLKKQKVHYMIIVVEQTQGTQLNRGMLRNIGFVEAEKICNFDCYFFHDVDMIPLNEGNIYQCGKWPRHHSAALERWNYSLPYSPIIGGVASFRKEQFKKVNGYSNVYFGWGGEDDDLAFRVNTYHKMRIIRYPMEISRYADLSHKKSDPSLKRLHFYLTWDRRVNVDGLNSMKYHLQMVEYRKLYTRIYVGINEAEVVKPFEDILKENITTLREHFRSP